MNKWMLRQSKVDHKKIAKEIKISEVVAKILVNRNIDNAIDAKNFLNPNENSMHDPDKIKDIQKGIKIIEEAIDNGEKIVVYGDYDVDGIISTYILYSALNELGADVIYHLPDREEEGYGLNSGRIRKLKEEGIDVILTCDNGIAAFEEIEVAKSLGIKVVITDHHDIPLIEEDGEMIPKIVEADAIINPKRNDCDYPFDGICGAGVAFKFLQRLFREYEVEEECFKYIEFVAIATVCDIMEIKDENRYIVKKGLELINETENIGLKCLIETTGLLDKEISEYHLGFVIGPCLNATGRLENAKTAVEMFLSQDLEEAKEFANKLNNLNKERQKLTEEATKEAIEIIEKEGLEKQIVKVVYSENIHESIAGIVAGRIKEKYYTPAIILTKGKDSAKGSARSIEGYDVFKEISKCSELLLRFGGHTLAAGLSIEEKNIESFRKKLNENAVLTEDELTPKIRIDYPLPLSMISFDLISSLENLKPFGKGNESPIFAVKGVEVQRIFLMGKEKSHLKLQMRFDNKTINGLLFSGADKFKKILSEKYNEEEIENILESGFTKEKFDFVYYPGVNEYNGTTSLQLNIKDLRISS